MEQETKDISKQKSTKESFFELLRFSLIALAVVVPIRFFIIEPFVVSGSSMFPTFENADYLIVDKISYKLGDIQRNDVVVFKYPKDKTKFFIKRVIGLPNEIVDIKGSKVVITNKKHPDGFELKEPYVKNITNSDVHFELKEDEYFVMGDNRSASSDSRYWGAVKKEFITGKALLRLLPVKNIDVLPGKYKQSE